MYVLMFFLMPLMINAMHVQTESVQHAKMPIALQIERSYQALAQALQRDLQMTQQFTLIFAHAPAAASAPFMLKVVPAEHTLHWQLIDQQQKQVMASGAVPAKGMPATQAHRIANQVWKALTGNEGFFLSKIAFCKEQKGPKGRTLKHIYIVDANGAAQMPLVQTPTINIAPRWHNERPLLFYSEFADANVRLMYVDMKKKRHVACNFDGVNMLPAFSHDGKVVFSSSKGQGASQLYYLADGKLQQLTKNGGNNFSPTLSADGATLYFCSDYQQRGPALFCFDMRTKQLDRIPDSCPSESPSCSDVHGLVAYCKRVKGVMQVCVYDPKDKTSRQLTFDAAIKQGVSWSPCGQYVVYSQQKGAQSELVMMQVDAQRSWTLLSCREKISFPSWSPSFEAVGA